MSVSGSLRPTGLHSKFRMARTTIVRPHLKKKGKKGKKIGRADEMANRA